MDFAIPVDHREKIKENKWETRIWTLPEEAIEHEGFGGDNYNWCAWKGPQKIKKGQGQLKTGEWMKTIQTTDDQIL